MKNQWLEKRYKGVPQDTDISLIQWSAGDANLVHWYNSQFVQAESMKQHGTSYTTEHVYTYFAGYAVTEHTPVIAGTMTGVVKLDGQAIQTFVVESSGVFTFQDVRLSDVKMLSGSLSLTTGGLVSRWNAPVENTELIVSYEYKLET